MNVYNHLKEISVFTIQDVNLYYRNMGSARSAVKRLMAKGKVRKIRNNLYTCSGEEWDGSAADRFQIASAITETACVSHLSAMEYHGFTDLPFDEVQVSSDARFQDFDFDGVRFHFIRSRLNEGIEEPRFQGGVRVTDPERTLTDCLKDLDKLRRLTGNQGPEELLSMIGQMGLLNEQKLLRYLSLYDNQFLYQKAGFLLLRQRRRTGLSRAFFDVCRSRIGQSKRYLTVDEKNPAGLSGGTEMAYDSTWRLVVPKYLL